MIVPTVPVGKFTRGDTLELRLLAMKADLNVSLGMLKQAPTAPFAGLIEKAMANVNQALVDSDKGLAYVAANPALNSTWGWTDLKLAHGAMPKPMPTIPNWVGQNYGRSPGVSELVNSGQGADQHLVDALNALRQAAVEFSNVHPEMNPYEVGAMDGVRDNIRADISNAVGNILAALDFAHTPIKRPALPEAELVVDGDFEAVPATTTNRSGTSWQRSVMAGESPTGFGWQVTTGKTFQQGSVTLLHEGFVATSGATTIKSDGLAFSGHQWLDLAGRDAGCLSQILPTEVGKTYVLKFAFANSPFPPAGSAGRGDFGPVHPLSATLSIKDTASDADLIAPRSIRHEPLTDYHWQDSGPITFTAQGPYSILQFTPEYTSRGYDGIFLDAVSVKAAIPPAAGAATSSEHADNKPGAP